VGKRFAVKRGFKLPLLAAKFSQRSSRSEPFDLLLFKLIYPIISFINPTTNVMDRKMIWWNPLLSEKDIANRSAFSPIAGENGLKAAGYLAQCLLLIDCS